MNKKALQRVLCFCLALCFCFSIAIKPVEAHAAVAAPWVVYALITYMAAMGITFTVAGGVDAMVKAVQDKVDEYQQVVVLPQNFWEVLENNVKLVPPPNGGGNFNPNRGKFFFAMNAAAAVTAFVTWLVSDGGWTEGQSISYGGEIGTFPYTINDEEVNALSTLLNDSSTSLPVDADMMGTVVPKSALSGGSYDTAKNYYINSKNYKDYHNFFSILNTRQ